MPPISRSGIRISPVGFLLIGIFVLASLLYFSSLYHKSEIEIVELVSMKALLIAGIDFAERGGQQVKIVHESKKLNEQSKGETLEGANDPLTQGDLLSHKAMMESFQKAFPFVKVVSEEKEPITISKGVSPAPLHNKEVSDKIKKNGDDEVDSQDVTVWIDPLDATQEYTENLLQYVTTMVCVAVRGVPTIGIIHKPFEGKTYWSWVGHGTNIEDHSASNSKHSIIVSRSHSGEVKETAKKAFGEDAEIIPAGGAGYKSLALFNGKASVYVHTTLIKKWDICSGNAILRHAGGRMTTLDGKEIDYSSNGDPKNKGGLVAALHNHDTYLKKLGSTL